MVNRHFRSAVLGVLAVVAPFLLSGRDGADRLDWWREARFGMFIHYGLYATASKGEWTKSIDRVSDEAYDVYRRTFDPDLFDAAEWARAAKAAGMKYVVLTTKHHDGFCMWDSAFTDYKITNTPFGRDWLKEVVKAFRAEGLRIGFYHSLIDWHHPDFTIDNLHPARPESLGGHWASRWHVPSAAANEGLWAKANAGRDMAKYRAYLKNQVRELLTKYGPVDILWFDYSYEECGKGKGAADWDAEGLVKLARSINPNIIFNDRLARNDEERKALAALGCCGDFVTPEQNKPDAWPMRDGRRVPWETCQTFSGSWGYNRDELTWKSDYQLIELLVNVVSKGGNLLMNVGPTARGRFDDRARKGLAAYARWMDVNARSVYGCTQAPEEFVAPSGTLLTYNPESRRLYLHLLDYPFGTVEVPFADRVLLARFLHDGSEVPLSARRLRLPVVRPDVTLPVVELILQSE